MKQSVSKNTANQMENDPQNISNSFSADKYGQQYERFIEMAAHDLQAPLRKLGVLTDQLINKYKPLKDDEVEQYTQRIHGCIAGMRSLIKGFTELAVTIPETMQYEECDLEEIIRKILQSSTSEIKQKEADISITGIPVIQGDKAQLRLLFKELLDNSFRFSKPSVPLKIDIRTEEFTEKEKENLHLPENRSYYKISLTDNGIGFEPEERERIFQPLIRLHGKSAFSGNGLGLALVKKIVDNHNGVVYAGGNTNDGSQVILIIPENP